MYEFRPFCNADPPHVAEIWREQPAQRGLMQPVTAALLEQLVFAKPYFDPAGFIVAEHERQPVGFIHAGFGANEDESALSTELGTSYLMMLRTAHRSPELADEMLRRAEAYLRRRGANVLYGGGIRPLNAFYLGLYGGSELPGVLASDPALGPACSRNGYRAIDRVVALQLELAAYRPSISRTQRQLRREMVMNELYAPPTRTWWEACTIGDFERLRFTLSCPGREEPVAEVEFWDVEPLSTRWGVATAGMLDLRVANDRRRQGLATFLLGEAFERLRSRGIMLVETQTMQQNEPAIALYHKLGFAKVDEGAVYRKE